MKKWICPVCGYVHEGDTPPAECPVCHVPGSKFVEQTGDMKLAAEHEYGIYAKTVKNNPDISDEDKAYIREQLMANFTGECSEVGYIPTSEHAPVKLAISCSRLYALSSSLLSGWFFAALA